MGVVVKLGLCKKKIENKKEIRIWKVLEYY